MISVDLKLNKPHCSVGYCYTEQPTEILLIVMPSQTEFSYMSKSVWDRQDLSDACDCHNDMDTRIYTWELSETLNLFGFHP